MDIVSENLGLLLFAASIGAVGAARNNSKDSKKGDNRRSEPTSTVPVTPGPKIRLDPRLTETFTSPTNIAVIKYWGKDNVKLNTPMNSSASVTLDQTDLHTITTISASRDLPQDQLFLNGKEVPLNGRALTVIAEVRKLARDRVDPTTGQVVVKRGDWPSYKIRIASVNTFPTGAGLASSAAGLACLVATLAKLFNAEEQYPGQLTAIARQGSGSASRSMYGGFVKWNKGEKADGTDSIAVQIADEKHWPELRAVILVVSDKEKDTASTVGMETSRLTSLLLQHRAANIVQPRLEAIETAYLNKDFETFGRITMQDSNQFHAVCLDTYPPVFYLNDVSRAIIKLIHAFNDSVGRIAAAYTFDAGPNAVIYTLDEHVPALLALVSTFFPAPDEDRLAAYCNRPDLYQEAKGRRDALLPAETMSRLQRTGRVPCAGDVQFVFVTRAGPGPQRIDATESLLDFDTGAVRDAGPKHKRLRIGQA